MVAGSGGRSDARGPPGQAAGRAAPAIQSEGILDVERAAVRAVEKHKILTLRQGGEQVPGLLEGDDRLRVEPAELFVRFAEASTERHPVGPPGGLGDQSRLDADQIPGRKDMGQ